MSRVVFNVRVTPPVQREAHVPHANEARLPLWHAHLVHCDCSCAVLAGRADAESHSDMKEEKKAISAVEYWRRGEADSVWYKRS